MTVIGDTLRRERLKRNLELDEISRELKISAKFLEAIEDEQFDKLPRGVFAKSFVRQYARLLGLDEDELAEGVQRAVDPPGGGVPAGGVLFTEHAPISKPSEIRVPPMEAWENVSDNRSTRSWLPALALVVVAMLACSGLYAWWQRSRHATSGREDVTAQTAPIERPSVPAAPPHEIASNTAQATPDPKPVAPALPATAAPPEAKPASTPAAVPPPNPNAPVRVAVTADELVWVLARSDGKFAFSGTLEANETRTFDANGTLLLRLGNAGGVNIKLNGRPVGSVGPKGQVRTVQFTSGGFQIVAPPKPVLPFDDLL